ncbi:uncharacterized protein J7T54_000338 [Emericellopsis cladophorae]|uniref:Ribonuclease T2-like n=1 Tax=Emericellopsis cladophorae TaxID=2686198 RepID=A0A9Q0BAU3_9HYPO|nr:uncharacterized protein J7T54_000338 [Emericellopsis cladophorae]KAI6779192.1 hypothetical protein J7T54_000338 [Emericellopsis cladophorae]
MTDGSRLLSLLTAPRSVSLVINAGIMLPVLFGALLGAGPAAATSLFADECPADAPLSCHANGDYKDTCCFNSPGGQLLLTQFWDTDPSTGPADSWTIHGLWPDNCDGSYEQFCAPQREVSNITEILTQSAPCTLKYMAKYWKDYHGDDEDFWEHEFNKHGTCISTLEPDCYADFEGRRDVVDFFKRAVMLFKTLPSYNWLAEAGILPSLTATYTLAQIQEALTAQHGHNVIINCNNNNEINELWYHYNVKGSIQEGDFIPAEPVGSPSTCKATGIKYLPKYTTGPPSTTTTTTSVPIPTGSPSQLSGKGRFYVSTDADSSGGFLISSGTWYRGGGTPATYTATPNADGETFTLSTSKGPCAVQADVLNCAASVSASDASFFGWDGSYLTYDDSNTFYATSLPSGTTQGVVYTVPKAVEIRASWIQS